MTNSVEGAIYKKLKESRRLVEANIVTDYLKIGDNSVGETKRMLPSLLSTLQSALDNQSEGLTVEASDFGSTGGVTDDPVLPTKYRDLDSIQVELKVYFDDENNERTNVDANYIYVSILNIDGVGCTAKFSNTGKEYKLSTIDRLATQIVNSISLSKEDHLRKKNRSHRTPGEETIYDVMEGSVSEFIADIKASMASGEIGVDEHMSYKELFYAIRATAKMIGLSLSTAIIADTSGSRGEEPWVLDNTSSGVGKGWTRGKTLDYGDAYASIKGGQSSDPHRWEVTSITNKQLGLRGLYFRPLENEVDNGYVVAGK